MGRRREGKAGQFTALERWLFPKTGAQEVETRTDLERGQGRQRTEGGREQMIGEDGRGAKEGREGSGGGRKDTKLPQGRGDRVSKE